MSMSINHQQKLRREKERERERKTKTIREEKTNCIVLCHKDAYQYYCTRTVVLSYGTVVSHRRRGVPVNNIFMVRDEYYDTIEIMILLYSSSTHTKNPSQ